ncbi:hypothetical protein QQF64_032842 [Cirrhinus molitorella]|uniref:Uncharacterized protein n=1 Tax=Cirrhinus molitorella TaxID=172907 RepID=A0ABR3MS85_9TELE
MCNLIQILTELLASGLHIVCCLHLNTLEQEDVETRSRKILFKAVRDWSNIRCFIIAGLPRLLITRYLDQSHNSQTTIESSSSVFFIKSSPFLAVADINIVSAVPFATPPRY